MKIENDFLIVLPMYNEVDSIDQMIREIQSYGYPLLVSDGGSTDGSYEKALSYNIHVVQRPGKNKGYGIKQSLIFAKQSNFKYIIYLDCDMTYPIDRIKDFIQLRYQYDMIIGVRDMKNMSLKSKILNKTITSIINFLFNTKLHDPSSGFRLLSVEKFIDQIRIEGIDMEYDLIGISKRYALKVHEVNIEYYKRVGESKLTLWEIIKVLFTLFVVRFIHK